MLRVGRLFLCVIIMNGLSLLLNIKGDFVNTRGRKGRHIFPLLGYLHGYKMGHSLALQTLPFVLSPIIILPSVNQQQSINIQKSGADDSFQENGGTFQTILPAKLSLNCSRNDPKASFRSSPNEKNLQSEDHTLNNTFRQINVVSTSFTERSDGDLLSTTDFLPGELEITTLAPLNTTASDKFYPNPMYNNDMFTSLQFTTPATESDLKLPSIEDKWKNFTSNMDQPENELDKIENPEIELQESASARRGSYQLTTEKYYPRPNTRYYNPYPYWYNAMVDQFSITTNSYREEEKESPLLPRYDDRWHRFSPLSKVVSPTSGFKPLAGLYYDGFLHKPLTKKTGFIPFDKVKFF